MKYEIYCTKSAEEELQELSKHPKRSDQIYARIDDLRQGEWRNGTRVKKLRSVNHKRTIFEARVDKARRMLFTIVKNRGEAAKAAILILHLELEHDDVIRKARALMQDDYTMEQYESEQEVECTIDDIVEETRETWSTEQDSFYLYLNQLKSFELDDESLIRILKKREVSADEFIQMKLSLSAEQRKYLQEPLPILLGGTAGSGKTTILVHKMLESDPNLRKIYVTYTKDLCEAAEKHFFDLVDGLDNEELYKKNTTFLTFDQLLRDRRYDKSQDVINRERFLLYFRKYARANQVLKDFPSLMMWEEIRGVIKGGVSEQGYVLTEKQYLTLTKDQAPNFVDKRKTAYGHFLAYQHYLKEHFKMDEQDLLAEAIRNNEDTYDMVFCDEVQDLTTLHIRFLHVLANQNAAGLFLTGDDQQILHHSGFRWANLKDLFTKQFKQKPPKLLHLSYNYRSVGAITDLAMSINRLQRQYTDQKIKAKPSASLFQGDKPYYFYNVEEKTMSEQVHDFGPHQAIIVRTEEEKDELRKSFLSTYGYTPLIFTIYQSKGLEFDRIVIWDFFKDEAEETVFWDHTSRHMQLGNMHRLQQDSKFQRQVSNECNLLYVGVTRASSVVYIYDRKPSSFWNMDRFQPYLDKRDIFTVFEQKTEEKKPARDMEKDWFEEGLLLMKKKLYSQALDCFDRVQDQAMTKRVQLECRARLAYQEENYEEAIKHFEQAEMYRDVLECYNVLEQFPAAVELSKKLMWTYRKKGNAAESAKWELQWNEWKVKQFDAEGHWRGASIILNNHLGRHYDAAVRFERLEEWEFCPDAYRRELHKCDPQDQKKQAVLEQKVNEMHVKTLDPDLPF